MVSSHELDFTKGSSISPLIVFHHAFEHLGFVRVSANWKSVGSQYRGVFSREISRLNAWRSAARSMASLLWDGTLGTPSR